MTVLLAVVALGVASWWVLLDLSNIATPDSVQISVATELQEIEDRPLVRIGVISRFAPNVIYAGYQPIMDYLNREGSYHYELKLSTSYLDAVEHLRRGEVVASFLGAWIYAHLGPETTLIPVAAPLNARGRSEFHAVLVTRTDSPVHSIADLRDRKVALPSAQAWSGNWLQTAALARFGLSPADLDSLHHYDHHHTVAWQVLRGHFDAGVVKESVAAKYGNEGLRSVARSTSIPGPPLVGCDAGPAGALEEIGELLLKLDPDNPQDRFLLDSWTREFSYGFTAVDRQQYLDAFKTKGTGQ